MSTDSFTLGTIRQRRTIGTTVAAALAVGLAIGLVAGVAGSFALRDRTARPGGPAAPAAAAAPAAPAAPAQQAATQQQLVAGYLATVSDLSTAIRQGDSRMAAEFRAQLTGLRTPQTIAALHSEAAAIVAGLMTAQMRHDTRAAASYRQQFKALCADTHAVFELGFCGWTLP